jgi:transcriptional regulator with XRE-family HTH domain
MEVWMAAGVLTLPRLYLGVALKRLRAESGKTLDELAAVLGKSRSRLITVLDGKGTLTADELARLLDFLGAKPMQRKELLKLGVEARKRSNRRLYADLLPDDYQRIVDLESMATEIWTYERGVVPGLLQIPEYVEGLMADGDGIWWDRSWEERRNRVTFRLDRQKLIVDSEPPKALQFVVSDEGLRTEVAGPETMRRQLEHLLSLMDARPDVSIRVLSSTVSHNPMPTGGLILLRLGEAFPPLALLTVVFGPATYVDDPVLVDRLFRARSRIEELALGPADSRKVIADLATGADA